MDAKAQCPHAALPEVLGGAEAGWVADDAKDDSLPIIVTAGINNGSRIMTVSPSG